MPPNEPDFDVAIIGGGPAGLSAAITLARARRRVVVFDHGQPRNRAALNVHCYLGHDGLPPHELRARGRKEAESYGAVFVDGEVTQIECLPQPHPGKHRFVVRTSALTAQVRVVLLATGVADVLPEIPGLNDFYGRSVHHCPYCDGWEHRTKRLAAIGDGRSAVTLALMLKSWSEQVTACFNGQPITKRDDKLLAGNGVATRPHQIARLAGAGGMLQEIQFVDGSLLHCDALFFSGHKCQRSSLPSMLGCECKEEGMIRTSHKHCTNVEGVYLAGDADGDTQFSVVAAGEGAIAGVAIDKALRAEDIPGLVPKEKE